MREFSTLATGFYDATLAVFYPRACVICGEHVENNADGCACSQCWRATRCFDGAETICRKCGALWPVALPGEFRAKAQCGRCREDTFTAARAIGVYEGALRAVVLRLKREPHLPARLVEALERGRRQDCFQSATKIIPVPLSAERIQERGFNQAIVIGQQLAKRSGLPFDEWSLQRTRQTIRHRAGMDAHGRRESVAQAFTVKRPRLIEKQCILLVDDVFTTGATVATCAAELLTAGAKEVSVLTLARVV